MIELLLFEKAYNSVSDRRSYETSEFAGVIYNYMSYH